MNSTLSSILNELYLSSLSILNVLYLSSNYSILNELHLERLHRIELEGSKSIECILPHCRNVEHLTVKTLASLSTDLGVMCPNLRHLKIGAQGNIWEFIDFLPASLESLETDINHPYFNTLTLLKVLDRCPHLTALECGYVFTQQDIPLLQQRSFPQLKSMRIVEWCAGG